MYRESSGAIFSNHSDPYPAVAEPKLVPFTRPEDVCKKEKRSEGRVDPNSVMIIGKYCVCVRSSRIAVVSNCLRAWQRTQLHGTFPSGLSLPYNQNDL